LIVLTLPTFFYIPVARQTQPGNIRICNLVKVSAFAPKTLLLPLCPLPRIAGLTAHPLLGHLSTIFMLERNEKKKGDTRQ